MKSAYEIALERLEKESGPAQKLSDSQREEIAAIDRRFDARVAEERLGFDERLSQATSAEELEQVRAEMADTLASLDEKREREKAVVWNTE